MGVINPYFPGLEYIRLGVINPYVRGIDFLRYGVRFLKVTVYLQRENFWIFIFLDKNKLLSKFFQTKKEFLKKSEYLPRNWDVSDFHRRLNFTLIDSIFLPV